MRPVSLAAGAALALLPACLSGPSHARTAILPLKTLHLYETGVGYFERSGPLPGQGLAALPLPAGHLDDALKTLVVLDKGGKAQVTGIEFQSSLSQGLARALAGLPAGADAPIAHRDLLLSLKGAAVEVQGQSGRLRGRIVEVLEEEPAAKDNKKDDKKDQPAAEPPKGPGLLLLTDGGEIRRLSPRDLLTVRPTDPAAAARLQAALSALSTRGAQAQRLLRVLGRSSGPVTLGYVAETALWRTSYRLVFPAPTEPGTATLSAFALVHNDNDEDWGEVRVRLVSGRPDSFLYPLGAPRYGRRELVHPENELSTVPQLLNTTVDAIWGDHDGEGLGLSGTGSGGGGSGSGSIGLGSIGTIGHGAGAGTVTGDSSLLSVGNLAQVAQATGIEAGALFSYQLSAPLRLSAHHSALVPFLQAPISAESITLVSAPGEPARSAVLFKNSSQQTLPEGPIALFGAVGFTGETILPRLKPGERRFLTHGTDLDVELSVEESTAHDEVQRLTAAGDQLVEHYLRKGRVVYALENRSGGARRVFLQLALSQNGRVLGADGLDYDLTAGKALAIFQAPVRKRLLRTVHTTEGLSRRSNRGALTAERMGQLAALSALSATERAVAKEAEELLLKEAARKRDLDKARAEIGEIEKDLGRLRENAKALAEGKGAGAAPFAKRMLEAEDRRDAEKQRLARLEAGAEAHDKAMRTALAKLAH